MSGAGRVFLVGAGPGDPGLLTCRARELLQAADVVVHDALISPEIMELVPPGVERLFAGKRGGGNAVPQERINEVLLELVLAGKQVVRLKGGDPYLFGRGAEEARYLAAHGVTVEVVPGVTAGTAAAAAAGIPLTHRADASAVAFVTGHEDPGKEQSALDWDALSRVGTLCLYMSLGNLEHLAAELTARLGKATPAAVISRAATPRQRTVVGTTADIAARVREAGLKAPALVLVGKVVRHREQLDFFERRPLFGKRIVVTRAAAQAGKLLELLRREGAEALSFPTIRIVPPADPRPLREAAAAVSAFDWLVFTSVNGVEAFFAALAASDLDARVLSGVKVAVIGSAGAERLRSFGLRPDLVPESFVAENLLAALLKTAGNVAEEKPLSGRRFLLPRAAQTRPVLADGLRAAGAEVKEVVAYETTTDTESAGAAAATVLTEGKVDAVTFTSGSTVKNFVARLGPEKLRRVLSSGRLKCVSIGPITSQTMRELGLPVAAEASPHDIPGLVQCLKESLHTD